MANTIENRLVAKDQDIVPLLRVKEDDASDFSFANFVYKDPRLDISSSSDVAPSLIVRISEKFTKAKSEVEAELKKYGLPSEISLLVNPNWFNVQFERAYERHFATDMNEMYELGDKYYQNLKDFGYTTWYEWSVANWGTKWDASEPNAFGDTLHFQTPWSTPLPVVVAISKANPEVLFELAWADEDVGSNTGIIELLNGEIVKEEIPESRSNRAFEIYLMFGEDDCIVKDKDGNYSYQID